MRIFRSWWHALAAPMVIVAIVLSPLRAWAATIPMLGARVTAIVPTATIQTGTADPARRKINEKRSSVYDWVAIHCDYAANHCATAAFPAAVGERRHYDRGNEHANWRALRGEGAGDDVANIPAAEGVATIETSVVRFTQSSVSQTLKTGENINDVIGALRGPGGEAIAKGFDPIRIFEQEGQLFTLDNRRLLIFSQAGREVPFVWAAPGEVAAQSWKFTATAEQGGGWFIRVK